MKLDTSHIGYPVHAGIDHSMMMVHKAWTWLPRTRGDRPYHRTVEDLHDMATPYTRGSTLATKLEDEAESGYPVHAGIDPSAP